MSSFTKMVGVLPAVLVCSAVFAQSETGTQTGADQQTVKLSPFTVTATDQRYGATNSVGATGFRAEIADIPVNINVITSELFEDQNADSLTYAIRNASSASSNVRNHIEDIWLRGFKSPYQVNRESALWMTEGLYNIDRIEVVKGPSAVLHGLVSPGGVVNLITNKPSFTQQSEIDLRYGSYDSALVKLRAAGPLWKDKLAYNFAVAKSDTETNIDYADRHEEFLSGSLLFKPTKSIQLLYEYTNFSSLGGMAPNIPLSHPAFIAAVNAGTVAPLTTARNFLNSLPQYGPNEPQSQVSLMTPIFGRADANPMGPENRDNRTGQNNSLEANVSLGNAGDLHLTAVDSKGEIDIIQFSGFRPQAGYAPGQWYFTDNATRSGTFTNVRSYRIEWADNFTLGGLGTQLLLGVNRLNQEAAAPSVTGSAVNWDSTTRPIIYLEQNIRAKHGGSINFPAYVMTPNDTDSAYLSAQFTMLGGRLHSLAGVRYTSNERVSAGKTLSSKEPTIQVGAVYDVSNRVGIYANYSEAFEPQNNIDVFGNTIAPVKSRGFEGGFKFGGKKEDNGLTATLSAFSIERDGIAIRDYAREAELGVSPIYITGGLQKVEGAECDIGYSPIPNFQVLLAASNLWTAETVESDVPQQIGVRLQNAPKWSGRLWTRYQFSNGALKGFYLGGGADWADEVYLHPSWDVTLHDSYLKFSLMAGYEGQFQSVKWDFRINVENLTNEVYYDGIYLLGTPRTIAANLRFSF